MAAGPTQRYGRQQGHSAMEGVNDAGLKSVMDMISDHRTERDSLATDHAKQVQDLAAKHAKAIQGLVNPQDDQ